jgi:hypothetical protein
MAELRRFGVRGGASRLDPGRSGNRMSALPAGRRMIRCMADGRIDPEMRTWRVHAPLGLLFGGLWLLSAFHLLVVMHREVFEWDSFFILTCAAPPILPFCWLVSGSLKIAALGLLAIAVVVVPWWFAARRPEARGRCRLAAFAIVAWWLYFDLGLGLAA